MIRNHINICKRLNGKKAKHAGRMGGDFDQGFPSVVLNNIHKRDLIIIMIKQCVSHSSWVATPGLVIKTRVDFLGMDCCSFAADVQLALLQRQLEWACPRDLLRSGFQITCFFLRGGGGEAQSRGLMAYRDRTESREL